VEQRRWRQVREWGVREVQVSEGKEIDVSEKVEGVGGIM